MSGYWADLALVAVLVLVSGARLRASSSEPSEDDG